MDSGCPGEVVKFGGMTIENEIGVGMAGRSGRWVAGPRVYKSYDNSTNITSGFGQAIYKMRSQEFTKVTIVDSLAPARSVLAGFWLRPDSFRRLPGGSSPLISLARRAGVSGRHRARRRLAPPEGSRNSRTLRGVRTDENILIRTSPNRHRSDIGLLLIFALIHSRHLKA